MAESKKKMTRPTVPVAAVERAREVVRDEYGDRVADRFSDGDLLDLALEILQERASKTTTDNK